MNWLNQPIGGIIEVEITFKCNLKCRHCNRFCNSEKDYNITRNVNEMSMLHINYLYSEIVRFPKLTFKTLRVIGGEPLVSGILNEAIQVFERLIKSGFINNIIIITNGTLNVDNDIRPYIKLMPESLIEIYITKGVLSKKEVYEIKEYKHRNISITPKDFDLPGQLCDRVHLCGVNYSIYGFSLCAPCLTPMILFPENHNRFLYQIPNNYQDFVTNDFENEVCSKCSFCPTLSEDMIIRNKSKVIGNAWQNQIEKNYFNYTEPNTEWIFTKG